MTRIITSKDLRPADMFLHRTKGIKIVPIGIRMFSGDDLFHWAYFNHASLYLGGGWVAEAIAPKYSRRKLEESCKGDIVHVYRWYNGTLGSAEVTKSGNLRFENEIGTDKYPYEPVIERAEWYLDRGERYSYEQLIFLALLLKGRNLPPFFGNKKIVNEAFNLLEQLLNEGKEPLICSEANYRCFVEKGYKINLNEEDKEVAYLGRELLPMSAWKLSENRKKYFNGLCNIANPNWVTPHMLATTENSFRWLGELRI